MGGIPYYTTNGLKAVFLGNGIIKQKLRVKAPRKIVKLERYATYELPLSCKIYAFDAY